MALVADYRDIADREQLFQDARPEDGPGKVLAPVWEALVLSGPNVGLSEISEANVDEWLFRLAVLERLLDKPLTVPCERCCNGTVEKEEGLHVCCEHCDRGLVRFGFKCWDVRRLVGLKLGVPDLTRAAFLKQCKLNLETVAAREVARLKREYQADYAAPQAV